jgi:hypothetical protein
LEEAEHLAEVPEALVRRWHLHDHRGFPGRAAVVGQPQPRNFADEPDPFADLVCFEADNRPAATELVGEHLVQPVDRYRFNGWWDLRCHGHR